MDDRPNIILSPHFDDAVFSLGGFIATAPERTLVVTVFAGTPPEGVAGRWDRLSGFATAAAAMQARCKENEEALAALGLSPTGICNLAHLDRQYRAPQPLGGMPDAELRSAVAADIRALVRRHGGSVNLFSPASAWHPDHRLLTDAVVELGRTGEIPEANTFLYQDQPYAYLELRRKHFAPLKFIKFDLLTQIAEKSRNLPVERTLLALRKEEIARKIAAARRYKSQFPFIKRFLYKMLTDFSYYQAGDAGAASRYVEVVYRLLTPDAAAAPSTPGGVAGNP